MRLTLYGDDPESDCLNELFVREQTLKRLRFLDARVRRKGLEALDPSRNPLIGLGMELDSRGRVVHNGYGAFSLGWQAETDSGWAAAVWNEVEEIREEIRKIHHTELRFLIWAGMGGSAEDKVMYEAAGLLKRGPRCYVLDSADPAKMKAILEDMARRAGGGIEQALRGTLVVGMALGTSSFEPVLNLEKLAALYARYRIDWRPNLLYLALPGSLLDQFGRERGLRAVEAQPGGGGAAAGRHSGPLTRGSLYPLALARADLRAWMRGAILTPQQVETAWRLSAFLEAQCRAGRDKITLLLCKPWAGAALWTKLDFEASLGKSEELGIKITVEERPKLANYRAPKDPSQDRAFLAVRIRGAEGAEAQKAALLKRAGYPVAVVDFPKDSPLSAYMQFMHYVVFGVARLRNMNFVTRPGLEIHKSIAQKIYLEARLAGGIERTREWQKMVASPRQRKWLGGLTLRFDRLELEADADDAAVLYASFLRRLAAQREVEYAELTFFGDTRYSAGGRKLRKVLDHGAEELFRARLKMAVDVFEGPAVNHSCHEMILGHGCCFSTLLISEKAEKLAAAGHTADYHRAQYLATQMALAERRRAVVSLVLKDLEDRSLQALAGFFHQAAAHLKAARV